MRQHNSSVNSIIIPGRIELHLNHPCMTMLHRAGLAGLWMTLQQLEKQSSKDTQKPGNLSWSLSSHSVSLTWEGDDFTVLEWFLKQVFQTDRNGLITLIGVGLQSKDYQAQLAIHKGITGTFLQHNKFLQAPQRETKVLRICGKEIEVKYKKVNSYAHQGFASTLCDKKGHLLTDSVTIAGWLYPGAVVRHARFGRATKFEEIPELAFALLFAPVACGYFILPKYLQRGLAQYALAIPDVTNLEQYATRFWKLKNRSYLDFYASGVGDAGLQFLDQTANQLQQSSSMRCQIISFGEATGSSQQKSRIEIIDLEATDETLTLYRMSRKIFVSDKTTRYLDWPSAIPSYAHRIITENLARGPLWWSGFYEYVNQQLSLQRISYEWKGLSTMIENSQSDDQGKKLFIKICHKALQEIYAETYDRTAEDDYSKIERKNERFRAALNRCRDTHTLRHCLSSFFAEASYNALLQDHWEELLPLITGEIDWRVTRDLVLLALATYPRVKNAEQRRSAQETMETSDSSAKD
jgi:CRISPR-associated protein Cas8a1/Csx13